jgi:hypothetical protein
MASGDEYCDTKLLTFKDKFKVEHVVFKVEQCEFAFKVELIAFKVEHVAFRD